MLNTPTEIFYAVVSNGMLVDSNLNLFSMDIANCDLFFDKLEEAKAFFKKSSKSYTDIQLIKLTIPIQVELISQL